MQYHIRTIQYTHVCCMFVHACDFQGVVRWVDQSSMCLYYKLIRADTGTLLGIRYVRSCLYVHVFLLLRLAQKLAHTCSHDAVMVARLLCFLRRRGLSLHFRRAVATAGLLRQRKRGQIATLNQIRSAHQISAQPAATWTGAPRLRAAVSWQSWKQRSNDVQVMVQ